MIQDTNAMFSVKQAVTATAASTDYIDLGASGTPAYSTVALVRDIGKSSLPLLAQVTTDFAGGTSIALSIQTDSDAAFGTVTTVLTTAAIPVATLKAGYQFPIKEVPVGILQRYIRAYYTVVGTMSSGNLSCGVVTDLQTNTQ